MNLVKIVRLRTLGLLVTALTLLSGCAGRQQAVDMAHGLQYFNEESEINIKDYLTQLENIERSRNALLEETQKTLSTLSSNSSNPHVQCLKTGTNALKSLVSQYTKDIQRINQDALSSKQETHKKMEEVIFPIHAMLESNEKNILMLTDRLRRDDTTQGTFEDLARLKNIQLNLYLRYNEIYLGQSEKITETISVISKEYADEISNTFDASYNNLTNKVVDGCKTVNQEILAKHQVLVNGFMEMTQVLRSSSNADNIKSSKEKLRVAFQANQAAGNSLSTYLKYNSLGPGSGAFSFLRAIPSGLANGLIFPDKNANTEAVKTLAQAAIDDLKQEIPNFSSSYGPKADKLKVNYKEDINKAVDGIFDNLKNKVKETLSPQ
ncbi:hypothetical protein [Marinibactrum halimedae]|uniref:Lipoprotein n=1 Tax=Marinibactrum halimedae TaxID=1444977 RepID=A0AA37T408_9GAMM|nr:hypothetical protein [Marinibactrum halimedae]MCD9458546.1 hypothetical protein [Marinibactrum halimedae]GLS26588.1 hypothetical protein GCM10007877_23040 [Marinibactrum halimedae]